MIFLIKIFSLPKKNNEKLLFKQSLKILIK